MSLLSTIKKILPGSSRSLHAMHEDMDRRFDEVFARIEQADNGINMNINYKFDTRLFPEIELLKQRQQSLSEQMRLRFELLARRAYPDLTPFELRCKILDALPDAEGDIRLMQQANAALMSKLDAICAANNINTGFLMVLLLAPCFDRVLFLGTTILISACLGPMWISSLPL